MDTATLLDGICFGEGPRWHDKHLWFSDMHAHEVIKLSLDGTSQIMAKVPQQPSGLGWLPDQRLVVVSMTDKKLLIDEAGELCEYADLSQLASYHCNDMVVDAKGRCYIGNFGFDLISGASRKPAELIMVSENGTASIVADDLQFPNGTVITPDGRTLIVAESMAARLTAFDIDQHGALSNRRVWAQMDDALPDGICLDEDGGIWVASPISNECLRLTEGGAVTDRIKVEHQAYACMLGGENGKRLFICTASSSSPEQCKARRDGRIEYADVSVAGAGRP
jgi:sugar lactone lactonase YvrE